MRNALRFRNTLVSRQIGEKARLKVAQGPDLGASFVILGNFVRVGRGEDNDVVLSDLKSSRNHAEIIFESGNWVIRDAGSANGIHINGILTRSGNLKSSDLIALGETVFEFQLSDQATMMLQSPPRDASGLKREIAGTYERKKSIQALGSIGGGVVGSKQVGILNVRSSENRKKILMGVTALVAIWVLFDSGSEDIGNSGGSNPVTSAQGKKSETASIRNLASYLPGSGSGELARTAETFFHSGFREYREGNYLRARTHFDTVLQIDPSHALAKLYMQNCDTAIEREVRFHLENGRRSLESGRIRSARGHFESVQRLLFFDRTNPAYTEAGEQIKRMEGEAG